MTIAKNIQVVQKSIFRTSLGIHLPLNNHSKIRLQNSRTRSQCGFLERSKSKSICNFGTACNLLEFLENRGSEIHQSLAT